MADDKLNQGPKTPFIDSSVGKNLVGKKLAQGTHDVLSLAEEREKATELLKTTTEKFRDLGMWYSTAWPIKNSSEGFGGRVRVKVRPKGEGVRNEFHCYQYDNGKFAVYEGYQFEHRNDKNTISYTVDDKIIQETIKLAGMNDMLFVSTKDQGIMDEGHDYKF